MYFNGMYIMNAIIGDKLGFNYKENINVQTYLSQIITNTMYINGNNSDKAEQSFHKLSLVVVGKRIFIFPKNYSFPHICVYDDGNGGDNRDVYVDMYYVHLKLPLDNVSVFCFYFCF
eukprot:553919_1